MIDFIVKEYCYTRSCFYEGTAQCAAAAPLRRSDDSLGAYMHLANRTLSLLFIYPSIYLIFPSLLFVCDGMGMLCCWFVVGV